MTIVSDGITTLRTRGVTDSITPDAKAMRITSTHSKSVPTNAVLSLSPRLSCRSNTSRVSTVSNHTILVHVFAMRSAGSTTTPTVSAKSSCTAAAKAIRISSCLGPNARPSAGIRRTSANCKFLETISTHCLIRMTHSSGPKWSVRVPDGSLNGISIKTPTNVLNSHSVDVTETPIVSIAKKRVKPNARAEDFLPDWPTRQQSVTSAASPTRPAPVGDTFLVGTTLVRTTLASNSFMADAMAIPTALRPERNANPNVWPYL